MREKHLTHLQREEWRNWHNLTQMYSLEFLRNKKLIGICEIL